MKKMLFVLFFTLVSQFGMSQSFIYQFEARKSYCTLEVDTVLPVHVGTVRAFNFLDALYYEMTFTPVFEKLGSGETMLIMIPTWHYHAHLEKVYGEAEEADLEDKEFSLKYIISEDGLSLTYVSSEAEKKYVHHQSSFSQKGHIKMTDLPSELIKASVVKLSRYPKGLRKNIQKRDGRLRDRLS